MVVVEVVANTYSSLVASRINSRTGLNASQAGSIHEKKLQQRMSTLGKTVGRHQGRFHGAFTGGLSAGFYNSVSFKELTSSPKLVAAMHYQFRHHHYRNYIFHPDESTYFCRNACRWAVQRDGIPLPTARREINVPHPVSNVLRTSWTKRMVSLPSSCRLDVIVYYNLQHHRNQV